MQKFRRIRWGQWHEQMGEITYELTRMQFAQVSAPQAWRPMINAYRCRDGFTICVDLGGVDKTQIDLRVEPRRVLLQGVRRPPEPDSQHEQTIQILAMEIDHGPFRREILLPAAVDPDRVTAEQKNGVLWIDLPLSTHA